MTPPKISQKQVLEDKIQKIFSILKERLDDYEEREQQITMVKKILEAFLKNKKIIVEAPTGVGKSLAYLFACLLYLREINEDSRIIVSTYTKTLQQQLIKKDLPLANKISELMYGEPLSYMYFYGSENYICLNKFFEFKKGLLNNEEFLEILKIEEWLKETKTGCVEEIDVSLDLWQEINREVDLCRARHCKFYEQCLYYKNIKELKTKDVIVVNHHLFFANILYSGKILPKNNKNTEELIIFDEAHNLEDVILQWLGAEVSNTQLKFLSKQIYNPKKQRGLITKITSINNTLKQNIINSVLNLSAAVGQFFSELNSKIPENKNEIRIFTPYFVEDVLTPALGELLGLLKSAQNSVTTDEEFFKINAFVKRIINFISIITLWLKCDELKNYIYWVEKEETRRKNLKINLKITPLDIALHVREKVYNIYDKILFTSATLSVNNNFDFFKKSIGLLPKILPDTQETLEISLSSPFDYENNVLLYLPNEIPNPKEEYEDFKNKICKVIKDLLKITTGNTFVLFTSFELMRWVYENIEKDFNIFIQEEAKYKLLEKYKSTKDSVLFGVDTFWQGVDIPGEKLISIIIPKLPFDVPEHPIIEGKAEKIKLEGGDPFREYLLPNAILKLKQGFGRLIRRRTDWGIISILDTRIKTRWYGKYFLKSLPNCKITTEINEVVNFYKFKKSKIFN